MRANFKGILYLALSCLFLVGCGKTDTGDDTEPNPGGDADSDGDSDTGGDSDTDTDSDGDSDVDSDADTDTDGDTDTGEHELDGACDWSERVGHFVLAEILPQSYLAGDVKDGVVPIIPPSVLMESDHCQLLRKNLPQCDPPCEPGEICDKDGNCVAYPSNLPVGTISVDGLLVPVEMEPQANDQYFDTTLPSPPFEPDVWIELGATGGDFSGFTLHGKGLDAIESQDDTWQIAEEQGLTIHWSKGTVKEATVSAVICIDQHGMQPANIACQGPDTGSFDIPSEMIDELLDLGISGFPTGVLKRTTADSTTTELGCIDFSVESSTAVEVKVASAPR